MYATALKMLFRDKSKYFGIVMGVMLASMVITQQGSIFVGIMSRTTATITDMGWPDIWVMDPKVAFIDDTKPLQTTALSRVRGVEGVNFAAPLYKGQLRARLDNGEFQNCIVIGLDDATLTGGPPEMLRGDLSDLRQADAVIVDYVGATTRLARANPLPNGKPIPLAVGDTMELNDKRGVVVGISKNTRTFQSQPIVYTTYSRAIQFAPKERKQLSFILVKTTPGMPIAEVCKRISETTGLAAYTSREFTWKTIMYFIRNTGIPINFGVAVGLGLLIGTIITGFMFYSFTVDNLRYFGTLKAMGTRDGTLLRMILLQALVVGVIGFGLGIGAASWFGTSMRGTPLAFVMTWQLLFVAGSAVVIICMLSAMLSMRRVMTLEPAIVFKG
ncbi:MAG: FtsX-like permease family protein [Planctomycetes bacterium]|nr:FtsX-like permease family protein [Planctomycetota bacterium]